MNNILQYINKKYYPSGICCQDSGENRVYAVVSDNSSISVINSELKQNDQRNLIINNSKFIIYKDTCSNIISSVIGYNSFYADYQDKNKNIHYIFNNSFYNFPDISYNEELSAQLGGYVYKDENNIIHRNQLAVWSSEFAVDQKKQQYKWLDFNDSSIYVNDVNTVYIYQSGCILYNDQYNILSSMFADNNLVGGFFNTVNFNIQNKISHSKSNDTQESNNTDITSYRINDLKLSYSFHNYNLINSSFQPVTVSSLALSDIYKFSINKLNIDQLSAFNTHIILNKSHIEKLTLENSIVNAEIDLDDYTMVYNTTVTIKNKNNISFSERTPDENYDSYANIYQTNGYFSDQHYPQTGNRVISFQTTHINNSNNAYLYGLQGHSHRLYNGYPGSHYGYIFPVQSCIKHDYFYNLPAHQTQTRIFNNYKCTYQPEQNALGDTYIPQNSVLPIGSIIGFYQKKIDDVWKPFVPFGFYQLIEAKDKNGNDNPRKKVRINVADSNSVLYNAMLGKLLGVTSDGYIELPFGKCFQFQKDYQQLRIISIIKYSENTGQIQKFREKYKTSGEQQQ